MHLIVNGYNLRGYPVGIANVVINFINSISKYDDVKITVAAFKDIPSCITERIVRCDNISIKKIGFKNPFLWLFFSFVHFVNFHKADLLWSPTPIVPFFIRKNIRRLVTVHDFVSRDFRDTMTRAGRLVSALVEPRAIKSADFLWCVSDYTCERLKNYYPRRRSENIITGSAPDPFFKKAEQNKASRNFLSSIKISKDYILFVGSLEPRKNLKFLLEIFAELKRKKDLSLVVVGARKWGKTDIKDIINSDGFPKDDVIFTDFVSEDELRILYNSALCYVSTSLNEGFGLPQAEAMKCECPVVSPYNSAMIEVVDGAGVTVKEWDKGVWVNSVLNAIKNRSEIIKKQNERIKNYSWDKVAQKVYNVLKENLE